MAAVLKAVQSQDMLNCSQDAGSSPEPKSLPVSVPLVRKSQATQETSKSDESTQVVKESLEDIPRRDHKPSPRNTIARPSAYDLPDDGEEELYEVTPKSKAKESLPQALDQESVQGQTQAQGAHLFTNFETQKALAKTAGRALDALFSDDLVQPVDTDQAAAPTKLKSLAQTSASDNLQPAPLTSTDPSAEKTSRSNSHRSHSQSGNSRHNSATSQTSVMASAAKTAADELKHAKKTNAPASALELLRAKKGKTSVRDAKGGVVQQTTNMLPVEKQPQGNRRLGNVHTGAQGSTSLPDTVAPTETTKSCAALPVAVTAELKPSHKQNPFVEDDDSEDDKPLRRSKKASTKVKGTDGAKAQVTAEEESQIVHDGMPRKRNGALRRTSRSGHLQVNIREGSAEELHAMPTQMPTQPIKAGSSTKHIRKPAKQAKKAIDKGDDEYNIKSSTTEAEDTNVKKRKAAASAKAAPEVPPAATTGRTRAGAAAQNIERPKQRIDNQQTLPAAKARSAEQKPRHAVGSDTEEEHDGIPADACSHVQVPTAQPREQPFAEEPGPLRTSNQEGVSQDQAIVLSDHLSSSSLTDTPAEEVPVQEEPHRQKITRQSVQPKTPANIRSSPPVLSQDIRDEDMRILQNSTHPRKPKMIAFDKSGPRNQGSVAVKTPGSKSIKYGQSSVRSKKKVPGPPSAKSKLDHKHRPGPSSFATGVRSSITLRRAASSNKADDVNEALADLRRTTLQSKSRLQMSPDTQDTVGIDEKRESHSVLHEQPLAADDGFVNINDDNEDQSDDVLMPAGLEDLAIAKSTEPPSMTQQGRPPSEKLNTTAYREQAAVQRPVRSAKGALHGIAKPQGNERSKAPAKAPASRGAAQAPKATVDQGPSTKAAGRDSRSKRACVEEANDERNPKRAKGNVDGAQPPTTADGDKISATTAPPENVMVPPAPTKPPRKSAKTAAPPVSTSKPKNSVANVPSSPAYKTPKPSQRALRKTSREIGYEGSPAAKGVAIRDGCTVLETYSQQQVGLVSEQTIVENTIKKHRHLSRPEQPPSDLHSSQALLENLENDGEDENEVSKAPPLHQPGPLSSNTKPGPAAPQSGSRLIPRLELSQSESEQVFAGEAPADLVDPFIITAVEAGSTQDSEKSSMPANKVGNKIAAKLDLMAAPKAIHYTHAAPQKVLQAERQKPHDKAYRVLHCAQEPVKPRSKYNIEPEEFQAETLLRRGRARQVQEDPDQTLVNDEPQVGAREPNKTGKREQTMDVHEQSSVGDQQPERVEHDNDVELSDPASDDLMSWRKTLKPHQLNLFEELIKTARRMTSYFVEQENGLVRTLEKCHQQELYMVKKVEMARAKQYEAKLDQLKKARKKNKKEYRRTQANLVGRLQDKELEKQARHGVAVKRQEENDELEQLISQLS